MDATRGCCTLSVSVTRNAEGFGFTLSQFSLYEAHKNSNRSINLEPLARKCRFTTGGLPIVDIRPHGPAASAGARQWDVIIEINSTDIRGLVAKDAIALTKSTDRLDLKIVRQGPPPSNAGAVSSTGNYGSVLFAPFFPLFLGIASFVPAKTPPHYLLFVTQLYGSVSHSPFITNSVPPLERVKNDDGSVQLKLQLRRVPPAEWGFTPFKYSMTDLKVSSKSALSGWGFFCSVCMGFLPYVLPMVC